MVGITTTVPTGKSRPGTGHPTIMDATIKAFNHNIDVINSSIEAIENIVKDTGEQLEGNIVYEHLTLNKANDLLPKQLNMVWAGSLMGQKVLEIGFNAGHSALFMLCGAVMRDLDFYVFDINDHKYMEPCLKHVASVFPAVHFKGYFGDSRQILTQFVAANPDQRGTFDLIHVDGGHSEECIISDLNNAVSLIRVGGTIIVDDTNDPIINKYVDALLVGDLFEEINILDNPLYKHRMFRRARPV